MNIKICTQFGIKWQENQRHSKQQVVQVQLLIVSGFLNKNKEQKAAVTGHSFSVVGGSDTSDGGPFDSASRGSHSCGAKISLNLNYRLLSQFYFTKKP
jgi:hypothetical protein